MNAYEALLDEACDTGLTVKENHYNITMDVSKATG